MNERKEKLLSCSLATKKLKHTMFSYHFICSLIIRKLCIKLLLNDVFALIIQSQVRPALSKAPSTVEQYQVAAHCPSGNDGAAEHDAASSSAAVVMEEQMVKGAHSICNLHNDLPTDQEMYGDWTLGCLLLIMASLVQGCHSVFALLPIHQLVVKSHLHALLY